MVNSLTKLFQGKNIHQNMTLRNQLNNVKIQNVQTIQSYFTRVSQIKEQLDPVEEEVEDEEVVATTLNGLPGLWDSFIQGMCAKRKLLLSKDSQDEARPIIREEKMRETKDQALTIQTRFLK